MPRIEDSSYLPPVLLPNGHALTIFPTMTRCVRGVRYERERLELPDGDFLDLDWSVVRATPADRAVVISHGLEGHSSRSYVLGLARALNRQGWDVVAWNFRGCSGEPNRGRRLYHSGASDDLWQVVQRVRQRYAAIGLVGFSLGGNLTLKLLGELGAQAQSVGLKAGVALSVPCDLGASADRLAEPENRFYLKRFLRDLREKVRCKATQFPDWISDDGYEAIRDFRDFDNRYTAPLHGFADAADYYARCSSRRFLSGIAVPTLLINAQDDPFLTPTCFPEAEADASACFFLETPSAGGHVGFVSFSGSGDYWSETRTADFLNTAWR